MPKSCAKQHLFPKKEKEATPLKELPHNLSDNVISSALR